MFAGRRVRTKNAGPLIDSWAWHFHDGRGPHCGYRFAAGRGTAIVQVQTSTTAPNDLPEKGTKSATEKIWTSERLCPAERRHHAGILQRALTQQKDRGYSKRRPSAPEVFLAAG